MARGAAPFGPFGLFCLLGLLGLPATPAWAASGRYLSPDDVATRAVQVVEGRVVEVQASLDPTWKRIVTRTRVAVERAWRGEPSAEVMVLTLGGEVADLDLVQWVPGEASFQVGERLLLFLEPVPARAELRPVGMRQGVYRPTAGGDWARDFDGLHTQAAADPVPRPRAPEVLAPASLPALLARVPYDPLADAAPLAPAPRAPLAPAPRAP